MRKLLWLFAAFAFVGCYRTERNCADFKTGTFEFEYEIDGVVKKTTFVRNDTLEIDYFEGKSDTARIRWVSDCEYVVEKLRPKTNEEKRGISMKILKTEGDTYTFEFGIVGSGVKQKGTVRKIKD